MSATNSKGLDENVGEASKPKSRSSRRRPAPSGPKPEIAFVNLTDSSGPIQDAEKRKLVRAHVMRGYQRQKQAQEEAEFEQFRQEHQGGFKAPLTSVMPVSDAQIPRQDYIQSTETTSNETYDQVDWTAPLDLRPFQPRPEPGRIFGQQVEGQWVPVTGSEPEENQAQSMNMIYDNSSTNLEIVPGIADYDLDNFLQEDPSAYFEQPALVPEEVECPLISQSITQSLTLGLSFSALNSGMLDPFNAMPGLKNARAQALMYHYNKVLVNTLIPVNPKDKWFNYAISDEALFHATMLHSAGHNAMLSGNNDLADPFQLKQEAIRLVNQRLGDPIKSISDLTLAAVACLVLFENQSANVEVSNVHMNGLRRMVNLRGGLQSLGLSGVLLRKVLWAECCNAMLSLTKPRLNLPEAARRRAIESANYSADHRPPILSTPTQDLNHIESCGCDKILAEVIIELRQLSDLPPINALDGAITDHLYLVERRLVTLLEPQNLSRHPISCQSIHRPSFIAALIYIYISLRDFPIQAPLFTALTERLSAALFVDAVGGMWEDSSYPMLLWVLTVGALATSEMVERKRFVEELERVVDKLGVRGFEEFVGCLNRIVWPRRGLPREVLAQGFQSFMVDGRESWRELWGEVEQMRRVRIMAGAASAVRFYGNEQGRGEEFYELF